MNGAEAKKHWTETPKKARLRMVAEARMRMPRTIELLTAYPEGPERERAFELVCAAVTESEKTFSKEVEARLGRFIAALGLIGDPIKRYVTTAGDYLKRK